MAYNYLNLDMDFKDGMIADYTCRSVTATQKNKKYLTENVLFHHDTLPIGEFAIGTKPHCAYRMGINMIFGAKLPILIAEKTGPLCSGRYLLFT